MPVACALPTSVVVSSSSTGGDHFFDERVPLAAARTSATSFGVVGAALAKDM
ncbi:MAG: hypothetical protein ACON36_05980 [Ilumatobacteraceae bacterium]